MKHAIIVDDREVFLILQALRKDSARWEHRWYNPRGGWHEDVCHARMCECDDLIRDIERGFRK